MLGVLTFSHNLKNLVISFRSERDLDHIYNMIWCWRFGRKGNYVVPNGFDVYDLIEYAYILLNIGSDCFLISAGFDDMYLFVVSC